MMATTFAVITASIILLMVLISIHEFGHLWVAKRLGVKVIRFSFGFGKQIWSRVSKRDGIEYCFSILPIGGYVKLLDTREGNVAVEDYPRAYDKQVKWKRFLIIIAGPFGNFIFAALSLWLVFMIGHRTLVPIIPEVINDSVLARAEVQVGSEIISVAGYKTLDWADVTVRLFQYMGRQETIPIVFKANKQLKTVSVNMDKLTIDPVSPDPLTTIGIKLKGQDLSHYPTRLQVYAIGGAVQAAYQKLSMYSYFSVLVIKRLLTGQISIQSLAGPLGIVAFAGLALLEGLTTFLLFMAIVSITLAVVNLVPFPGLDGGQVLYLGYEFVVGKSPSAALQLLLLRLGIIFLAVLFVQVLVNDLNRILT